VLAIFEREFVNCENDDINSIMCYMLVIFERKKEFVNCENDDIESLMCYVLVIF
jgi:hypothetical protein